MQINDQEIQSLVENLMHSCHGDLLQFIVRSDTPALGTTNFTLDFIATTRQELVNKLRSMAMEHGPNLSEYILREDFAKTFFKEL